MQHSKLPTHLLSLTFFVQLFSDFLPSYSLQNQKILLHIIPGHFGRAATPVIWAGESSKMPNTAYTIRLPTKIIKKEDTVALISAQKKNLILYTNPCAAFLEGKKHWTSCMTVRPANGLNSHDKLLSLLLPVMPKCSLHNVLCQQPNYVASQALPRCCKWA